MRKPLVRLYPTQILAMPWERPEGAAEGVFHKILARDSETGSHTRLLRVEPGVDTRVYEHDHWEEVYILQGGYQIGDEYHPTGTYTCKPPHVKHGPFSSTEGYLCLEIRDYAPVGGN